MWFRYAPRKSCSRTSDDAKLARPVKDTDLLLLGSAHSVPWEDCFRRWHSMARRVLNSLEQWAHLNPTAWVMLCCPADRITHGTWSRLQCPGIWLIGDDWLASWPKSKLAAKNREPTIYKVLVLPCACLGLFHLPSDSEGICNHKHADCVSHCGKDNLKMTTSTSYTTK